MADKKLPSFEEAMAGLEEILEQLGDENTTLDESISLYAKAAQLVQQCNETLAVAKIRIDEIGQALQPKEDA